MGVERAELMARTRDALARGMQTSHLWHAASHAEHARPMLLVWLRIASCFCVTPTELRYRHLRAQRICTHCANVNSANALAMGVQVVGQPLVRALRAAYSGSTSVEACQPVLNGFITAVKCAPAGLCMAAQHHVHMGMLTSSWLHAASVATSCLGSLQLTADT